MNHYEPGASEQIAIFDSSKGQGCVEESFSSVSRIPTNSESSFKDGSTSTVHSKWSDSIAERDEAVSNAQIGAR